MYAQNCKYRSVKRLQHLPLVGLPQVFLEPKFFIACLGTYERKTWLLTILVGDSILVIRLVSFVSETLRPTFEKHSLIFFHHQNSKYFELPRFDALE